MQNKYEKPYDWHQDASCNEADTELFFHPDGERGKVRRAREQAAKAICRKCVVITACLQDSLDKGEMYGTRGGLSEKERQEILSRQKALAQQQDSANA